jgi:hypothetical protein
MFGRQTALPCPLAPPVAGWLVSLAEQRSPFAPVPLQNLHHYYELLRPCAPHRYSGPCGVRHLDVSLGIRATGSHVPYESLVELRAASMPDAARAVSGHLPSSSRRMSQPPVLTSSNPISTRHQRFACARLSQPCLPGLCPGVSATLTTIAFDDSSLRWLEINT